jgi:hypothetical protein
MHQMLIEVDRVLGEDIFMRIYQIVLFGDASGERLERVWSNVKEHAYEECIDDFAVLIETIHRKAE